MMHTLFQHFMGQAVQEEEWRVDSNTHIIYINEIVRKVKQGFVMTTCCPLSLLSSKDNQVLRIGHQPLKFEPKTAGIENLFLL